MAPPYCRWEYNCAASAQWCGGVQERRGRGGWGRRRMRRGAWRGGGPHLSVVARECAAAQHNGAPEVVEGAAILSRGGTIAPRQRNGVETCKIGGGGAVGWSQDADGGQWRGGGPHVISVVARERAVAQRGGAPEVVDGPATLSRGRIAPRQRNGLGRDGAESGAVGSSQDAAGGAARRRAAPDQRRCSRACSRSAWRCLPSC